MDGQLGLGGRIGLAFAVFFRVLLDGVLAFRVQRALTGAVEPPAVLPPPAPPPAPRPVEKAPEPAVDPHAHHPAVVSVLAALQREGRFVDFLQEDVASFADADVGAAARVVHEGCRKLLRQYVTLAPVRSESEGDRVTLPAGFDASSVRLTGNVVGSAPFTGTLRHKGWKATAVTWPAPAKGGDSNVVAPAEVEL